MTWWEEFGATVLGGFLGALAVGCFYWRDWLKTKKRYSNALDAYLADARRQIEDSTRRWR